MICHSAFSSLSGLGPLLRYPTSLDWDVSCKREAGDTTPLDESIPHGDARSDDVPALSVELHVRHHRSIVRSFGLCL